MSIGAVPRTTAFIPPTASAKDTSSATNPSASENMTGNVAKTGQAATAPSSDALWFATGEWANRGAGGGETFELSVSIDSCFVDINRPPSNAMVALKNAQAAKAGMTADLSQTMLEAMQEGLEDSKKSREEKAAEAQNDPAENGAVKAAKSEEEILAAKSGELESRPAATETSGSASPVSASRRPVQSRINVTV